MADCKDCKFMNLEDMNKYGEAYCSELKKYTSLTGSCRYFDRRYSYSTCYLTTMYCDILGKPDNCFELETLRGYRDWYMKVDPKCIPLLREYDEVGPVLSENIRIDSNRDTVVNSMSEYINAAIDEIFNEEYEGAKETYIKMVNMLKERYGVKEKVKRLV